MYGPAYYHESQVDLDNRARAMAQQTHTAEHIAFALWPERNKYRNLHAAEFKDELSLLVAVKVDLGARNFHDVPSARDFYKDLNHSV